MFTVIVLFEWVETVGAVTDEQLPVRVQAETKAFWSEATGHLVIEFDVCGDVWGDELPPFAAGAPRQADALHRLHGDKRVVSQAIRTAVLAAIDWEDQVRSWVATLETKIG